ncbi:MAG TPA: Hsp33 family molecular chaperone HslO, partial [Ruminococcaceae bacterium]|nr:Hsp33 family molecular chaperone HslO [Oscillospiraceae bacterium]
HRALEGFEVEFLDERTAAYTCDCSRERVENALHSMRNEELEAMIAEDGGAEVRCHFCGKTYSFDVEALRNLMH